MLLSDFIRQGTETLSAIYPTEEARSIVLLLCESMLGTKNYTYIVSPSYEIPSRKEKQVMDAIERLSASEPIQYVIGKAEFYGRTFKVSPAVLIPRLETEILCMKAVETGNMMHRRRVAYGEETSRVRILDLCTGSGCIAWTMALSVEGARVVGTDISREALKVAESQDFSAELREKGAVAPSFVEEDLLGFEGCGPGGTVDSEDNSVVGADSAACGGSARKTYSVGGTGISSFDLILGNPPYVRSEERGAMRRNVLNYEPPSALFVPDEDPLLYYRAIADRSRLMLAAEGVGFVEINEALGTETEGVFREAGFSHTEVIKDFSKKDRVISYWR